MRKTTETKWLELAIFIVCIVTTITFGYISMSSDQKCHELTRELAACQELNPPIVIDTIFIDVPFDTCNCSEWKRDVQVLFNEIKDVKGKEEVNKLLLMDLQSRGFHSDPSRFRKKHD